MGWESYPTTQLGSINWYRLWKAEWRFLIKLNIELPYNLGISLLDIFLKETKTLIQKDAWNPMTIATLFTIAKIWKQFQCPSRDELMNWCFWTVVLEKTLESPLDCKEIKPVNPKGNQSWILTGRTDAEAEEAPILRPPDAKSQLIGKDPDAGKDWRQEKGTTEDEMVGWHHRLNGHECEQALGIGDGQGGSACRSPWGRKESDTTEHLNWTELKALVTIFLRQFEKAGEEQKNQDWEMTEWPLISYLRPLFWLILKSPGSSS